MTVFANSKFACFVDTAGDLVGAGRALADGLDCAYIADVAVHPDHQGRGLGEEIIRRLVRLAAGHKKFILYANPGTERFNKKLGFLPMNAAMAIWHDPTSAIRSGIGHPPGLAMNTVGSSHRAGGRDPSGCQHEAELRPSGSSTERRYRTTTSPTIQPRQNGRYGAPPQPHPTAGNQVRTRLVYADARVGHHEWASGRTRAVRSTPERQPPLRLGDA